MKKIVTVNFILIPNVTVLFMLPRTDTKCCSKFTQTMYSMFFFFLHLLI